MKFNNDIIVCFSRSFLIFGDCRYQAITLIDPTRDPILQRVTPRSPAPRAHKYTTRRPPPKGCVHLYIVYIYTPSNRKGEEGKEGSNRAPLCVSKRELISVR